MKFLLQLIQWVIICVLMDTLSPTITPNAYQSLTEATETSSTNILSSKSLTKATEISPTNILSSPSISLHSNNINQWISLSEIALTIDFTIGAPITTSNQSPNKTATHDTPYFAPAPAPDRIQPIPSPVNDNNNGTDDPIQSPHTLMHSTMVFMKDMYYHQLLYVVLILHAGPTYKGGRYFKKAVGIVAHTGGRDGCCGGLDGSGVGLDGIINGNDNNNNIEIDGAFSGEYDGAFKDEYDAFIAEVRAVLSHSYNNAFNNGNDEYDAFSDE